MFPWEQENTGQRRASNQAVNVSTTLVCVFVKNVDYKSGGWRPLSLFGDFFVAVELCGEKSVDGVHPHCIKFRLSFLSNTKSRISETKLVTVFALEKFLAAMIVSVFS